MSRSEIYPPGIPAATGDNAQSGDNFALVRAALGECIDPGDSSRIPQPRHDANDLSPEMLKHILCDTCDLMRMSVDDELRRQFGAYVQRHDMQTGLLNHQAFQESLAAQLRDSPPGQDIALIWIDLLNLRREFSLWGSARTEALIRQVAAALRFAVEEDALLGRYGGRCFVVSMRAVKFDRIDRRRIQAVVDSLSPARVHGAESKPEIAAGVAFYPSDTLSPEDLVRFASMAASRASYVKSPAVMPFHAGMNSMIVRDHLLEVEMDEGLRQRQFTAAYQPKIDLATGRLLGAEALMRWNHPEWGSVSPAEFIPIAERSDLIHRLFDFILRTALTDARRWRDMGLSLPIISVNASAADLRKEDFVRSVRNTLAELPIGPTQLELEVTESMLLDDVEMFARRLRQLHAIGVSVAIDDFGTRYTGFNVLQHLPLDVMKIDQCFIRGIDRSPDMRALCQTIVAMGRHLKLRTVAEGIEELGELKVLQEIGCEAGQGYLFRRPVAASEFSAFLREWPERMRDFGYANPRPVSEIDRLRKVG
jgi:diguanylate cyclase (GGDEF)-like protein